MTASLLVFQILITSLISLAAWLLERSFAALMWPRRTVWVVALALSWAIPNIAVPTPHAVTPAPRPTAIVEVTTASPDSTSAAQIVSQLRVAYQQALPPRPNVDEVLNRVSSVIRISVIMIVAVVWAGLYLTSRTWRATNVDGTSVLLNDTMGPAVIGFLRPRIVVPRWLMDLPRPDRRFVLAHEQAHIAARDPWLLLAGFLFIVGTAGFPFVVPVVWQFWRLRFAIEVDCDRRVVRGAKNASDYGEALLAAGEKKSGMLIGALALTERASQLERRIRIIVSGPYRHARVLASVLAACSIALVIATGAVKAQLAPAPRGQAQADVSAKGMIPNRQAYSEPDTALKSLARGDMAALSVSADHPLVPNTAFLDTQGHSVTLAGLKGKLLVVDLWATWCGGCVAEMPTIAKLQAAYAGKIIVAPISMDKPANREKARAFISQFPQLPFYQYSTTPLAGTLTPPVGSFPTFIIFDSTGHELARLTGRTADWNGPNAHAVFDYLLSASL